MRTDFMEIENGERVTLHPSASNPLHKEPVKATFQSGYFYCDGTDPMEGPDYYLGDVMAYNDGYTVEADDKVVR